MPGVSDRSTRWQLVHDVVIFQIKLGLEALLDIALIPISLAAAGLDFVFGNWRSPRLFHAVLRVGERCEDWIDLWGIPTRQAEEGEAGVDGLIQSLEEAVRNPRTGPESLRALRLWAAKKLAGDAPDEPPP
jgi:hypothetical protein